MISILSNLISIFKIIIPVILKFFDQYILSFLISIYN